MSSIKKIIGVASGKGGVGKSMIALNLALALSSLKQRVGLLDADIYGPSQPTMMRLSGKRPALGEGGLVPLEQWGIKTMSIGYLIDVDAPMVWRGPMIGKALEQLYRDTRWGELDYLIIDLPPGTGDVQLTLCQKVPVTGVLLVTTPGQVALSDVKRAAAMFRKLNVPLLGVIENMSTYHCPNCSEKTHPFGEGGGAQLAKQYDVPLLASLPLAATASLEEEQGATPLFSAAMLDLAHHLHHTLEKY